LYFPILILAVTSALKGKYGTAATTGDRTGMHERPSPTRVEGEALQGVAGSVGTKFSSSSKESDYWMSAYNKTELATKEISPQPLL